ncbi:hypothetical protein IY145_25035 [Methylosinus sp. H3A]|nr:hypothetical protein [Methylosinus sp. H3A]
MVALDAGSNTVNFTIDIPTNAELTNYKGFISVNYNNPWTGLAQSPFLASLDVSANPSTSPPVLTGNGAVLLWEQDFSVTRSH